MEQSMRTTHTSCFKNYPTFFAEISIIAWSTMTLPILGTSASIIARWIADGCIMSCPIRNHAMYYERIFGCGKHLQCYIN